MKGKLKGLKMPGINGVEALHLIKTASPRRKVP
jgi:hypothetical protein